MSPNTEKIKAFSDFNTQTNSHNKPSRDTLDFLLADGQRHLVESYFYLELF